MGVGAVLLMGQLDDIRDVLQQWIEGRDFIRDGGWTLIDDHPGAPKPEKPYIVLNFLISGSQVGQDEVVYEGDGIFKLRGVRKATCSLLALGLGSEQMLCDLRDSLQLVSVRGLFYENGLAVSSEGSVQDLTKRLVADNEERAVLDLGIGYRSSIEEDVGWFDTVETPTGTLN